MKLKLALVLTAFVFCTKVYAQTGFPFDKEVMAFKHQDSLSFPKPGGILFIGSSSIRFWGDLEQRFSNAPIIKRGVGGSELWQWVAYYPQYIVYPYHPAKIFIYVGENDIASGRSAKSLADNFAKLWDMINQNLPDAEIYFLSLKLSPSRAKYYTETTLANKLISDYIKDKPKSHFIDVNTSLMKGVTAVPDSSLFKADYLHLNSKGYDKWQGVLQDYIK